MRYLAVRGGIPYGLTYGTSASFRHYIASYYRAARQDLASARHWSVIESSLRGVRGCKRRHAIAQSALMTALTQAEYWRNMARTTRQQAKDRGAL